MFDDLIWCKALPPKSTNYMTGKDLFQLFAGHVVFDDLILYTAMLLKSVIGKDIFQKLKFEAYFMTNNSLLSFERTSVGMRGCWGVNIYQKIIY